MKNKTLLFVTLLFLCQYSIVPAQSYNDKYPPYTLSNTEQRSLHSKSNGITYKLYISYPPDYHEETDKTYPVVYLLDADYSFAIAKNTTDHLSERNDLQEVILVGIAYAGQNQYRINRTRDYTPTHTLEGGYGPNFQKVSGGGPEFLDFMEMELFPFVDKNFRTNGERIITGHSFGGLFVCWVMLNNPGLFNGYIAVSPSLWYDDHYIFKLEKKTVKNVKNTQLSLYLTVGDLEINNRYNMPRDLRDFVDQLNSREHKNLRMQLEIAGGETHNSVFPFGFTRGIRFVLDGAVLK